MWKTVSLFISVSFTLACHAQHAVQAQPFWRTGWYDATLELFRPSEPALTHNTSPFDETRFRLIPYSGGFTNPIPLISNPVILEQPSSPTLDVGENLNLT